MPFYALCVPSYDVPSTLEGPSADAALAVAKKFEEGVKVFRRLASVLKDYPEAKIVAMYQTSILVQGSEEAFGGMLSDGLLKPLVPDMPLLTSTLMTGFSRLPWNED